MGIKVVGMDIPWIEGLARNDLDLLEESRETLTSRIYIVHQQNLPL